MAEVTGTISINDDPAQDLFPPLLEMVVEDDHRMAAVFRIKVSIRQQEDGHWTYLDDDRIKLWNKVTIAANTGDQDQKVITGYITHLKPHFEADESNSFLEICGMDPTSLMSIEEKIKDWPNRTDSDIAKEIFDDYGLTPEVDETSITHEDTVSTIIQRETDIQFLKRLARRNGFECFARDDTGYFRKPVLADPPSRCSQFTLDRKPTWCHSKAGSTGSGRPPSKCTRLTRSESNFRTLPWRPGHSSAWPG